MPNWTKLAAAVLIASTLLAFSNAAQAVVGHITIRDKARLKEFFQTLEADSLKDPSRLVSVIRGLRALNESLRDNKAACGVLKAPISTPASTYYHAYGLDALSLKDCPFSSKEVGEAVRSQLNDKLSAEDLFYLAAAAKITNSAIDKTLVVKMVEQIRTKDSSPTTMAFIYQTVSTLSLSKKELQPYIATVNSVLAEADELNGRQLFYEKGLYTTSMVAIGISDLVAAYGDASDIPEDKLVKLINFIYIRLHSNNLRAAAYLLTALKAFANNPVLNIVAIESVGPEPKCAVGGNFYRGNSLLKLQLFTVWGDPFTPASVTLKAGGLRSMSTQQTVGPNDRGSFATANDKSVFTLDLTGSDGTLPPHGLYELELTGKMNDANDSRRMLGLNGVRLSVRILGEVKVVQSVLSILDAVNDHHTADITLKPYERYTASGTNGILTIPLGHQAILRVRLADEFDKQSPLTAHQVFVQLTHHETKQAITFVCNEIQAEGVPSAKAYQLRLDPESSSADFDSLSGMYKMELFVGDPFIRKPIIWHMVDLDLNFSGTPGEESKKRTDEATDISRQRSTSAAAAKRASGPSPLVGSGPTSAKPVIEHLFKEPEKRAPRVVAWAFTAACAVPLFGLLLGWSVLGVNLWNFRFRISNVLFHVGLVAIFCLYYIYWRYLDMFTTLVYLAVLAAPTFLAGNSVLRAQLSAHQMSSSTHTGGAPSAGAGTKK
ncbi:unnamed protein product [Calicophoron daubneyi]|uniref:Dolichyl-diphosphooligosaccharide--protein glycosyltransferase subunit 2 n=1 Tax=Calicophoron daubneyi TaxID=300641 RepID=A0AAV2SWB6_CALDB